MGSRVQANKLKALQGNHLPITEAKQGKNKWRDLPHGTAVPGAGLPCMGGAELEKSLRSCLRAVKIYHKLELRFKKLHGDAQFRGSILHFHSYTTRFSEIAMI